MDKNKLIQKYNIAIFEIVKNKIDNSDKNIDDFDYKSDLYKIFEYFSCIKLTHEYDKPFYEYNDIPIEYKELNCMSKNDTGIDACDLIDTIVQCKLRTNSLTWGECATFFGSVLYRDNQGKLNARWNNLIITRNQECKLSDNLNEKLIFNQFTDKTYPRTELLSYCKNLIKNPPEYFKNETIIEKRDYQEECIKLINDMDKENLIICLPTGTGKNFIITHSLQFKVKYLILVPRIMLMEQIKDEIIKYHPKMKSKIQMIGDSNNEFKSDKDITICVYNSVAIVKDHIELFNKIFVDEAHHIIKPEIYKNEDDYSCSLSDLDSEYEDDFDNDEYFDDEEELNEEELNEEDNEEDNFDDDNFNDDDEPRTEQKEEVKEEPSDLENENCDNKTFTKIIKEFSKLNNNVYLSATIDEHHGFAFYKKDIREMIEKKYLCDYTINIPIFAEDPTNLSICKYLVNNYRNIIIYCNSHNNGKSINKLMNLIQKGCSEYIDCNTSRKKRNDILSNFKSGKLLFLVNVKILVEGFDAPITKGVCFMSLPSSSITLIQIIGRSLRLDPLRGKTIANVILPFSKKEDEKAICNFMKVIAKNDYIIRKSYDNKKNGGYFEIENIIDEENIKNIDLMEDIQVKYELIFDSMGTLKNNEEIWEKKLEKVKKYIDDNKKKPSKSNKDKEIKSLAYWITNQQTYYKNKSFIMSSEKIYNKYTDFINDDKYKEYFLDKDIIWSNNLEKLKEYINKNKKRPSFNVKDKEIKSLGIWINYQQKNYKKKLFIMLSEKIYEQWNTFINDDKYKEYFLDNDIIWYNNLEKVKDYIHNNKKRPSDKNKNKEIQYLATWIHSQQKNYKNKTQIMSSEEIYNKYTDFINDNKYKEYFLDNDIIWYNTLEKLKEYIDDNKKRPSRSNKDKEIKSLNQWINTQNQNYKNKTKIMSSEKIYEQWNTFINDDKYKEYFLDNDIIWYNTLEKLKEYIDDNKKIPSCLNKNKEIKSLGSWTCHQQSNYKKKLFIMSSEEIYNKWTNFINDDKYKEYFLDNNIIWYNNLEKLKEYIDDNKKIPSRSNKNKEIKSLGIWIATQNQNYKNKTKIMSSEYIYNKWTTFINDDKYKEYFLDNK